MSRKLSPATIQKRTNILGIIVNLIALAIFIVAIYYLFTKGFLQFLGFTIYSLVLLTPRFIYKKINNQNQFQPNLLSWVEILVTTAIILNSIGYIWMFNKLFFIVGYDTFAHFVTPILITLALALILTIYYNIKNIKINKSKFVLTMVVITIIYCFFWEFFEYIIDLLFGVGIYGEEGQPLDTYYDLTADFLSLPFMSVIIYKYFDHFNAYFAKIKRRVKIKNHDY